MVFDLYVGTEPGGLLARNTQDRVMRSGIGDLAADLDNGRAAAPGWYARHRRQPKAAQPRIAHQRVRDLRLQLHGLRVTLAVSIVELHRDADDHDQSEDEQKSQRRRAA